MKQFKKPRQQKVVWKKYLTFFLIFTSILVGGAVGIKEVKASLWDGQTNFAWVEQDKDIKVILLIPQQKKEVAFAISAEALAKVGFGFGEYRLGKVFDLGELEKKGGKLLARTAQDLLGIGVTGWQIGGKSNLSHWDRLRIAWFRTWQEKGRVRKIDWQQSSDDLIHQAVFDEKIAAEGLTVAVLNATDTEGVGNALSRQIDNLGFEVTLIGNKDNEKQSYFLINERFKNKQALLSLRKWLNINLVKYGDVDEYRSDIVVVVGEDYTTL
ncbi:MAG: LytR C-terminal domain-containing protein [Candidatus Beckwithbacteria bacterium]|nr:LytR C-terminal domain-containing protein [Candidatus Beckwithbacteria bacterium]